MPGENASMSRPGMETDDCITQKLTVEMGINFSGKNGLVSQHFLHSPQVRSAVYQMRGKGMAECMRTDVLFYAGRCCQVLDYRKYHNPAEPAATPVEEKNILVLPFDAGK